jgi:hypothetical protein
MKSNFVPDRPDKGHRLSDDGIDLFFRDISPDVRQQLPGYVVRVDRVVPIGLEGEVLVVAMEDPDDVELHERIRFITDRPLRITVASSRAIDQAIKAHYPFDDD